VCCTTSVTIGSLRIESTGAYTFVNGHRVRAYNEETDGSLWNAKVAGNRMTAGRHTWVLRRNKWVRKDRLKKKKKRPLLPPVEDAKDKMDGGAQCVVCFEMHAGRVCLTACGHMHVCNVCLHTVVADAKKAGKKPKCPLCNEIITQAVRCYSPAEGGASSANA